MKKLLEHLKKQKELTEEKISKREDYFDNKSDNWQESERGSDYEDETFKIEDFLSNIEECIDYIEESLE